MVSDCVEWGCITWMELTPRPVEREPHILMRQSRGSHFHCEDTSAYQLSGL